MSTKQPYPCVLVLREKHAYLYFHVANEDQLHRAALLVLGGRFRSGYFYPRPTKEERPQPPDYVDEAEIAKLKGVHKDIALRRLAEFKRGARLFYEDVATYNRIRDAVRGKDGAVAWACLKARNDIEYEGVELVAYETGYQVV